MARFLIRRLFFMVASLFFLSVVIFVLVEVVPGDTAQMTLGQFGTVEGVEALRHRLGLDQPAHVRYLRWASGIVKGDLGTSLYLKLPIRDLLLQRIGYSLVLAGATFFLGVPLALILGVVAGVMADRLSDQLISTILLLLRAMPDFVTGMFLIVIFSVWLDILPPASAMSLAIDPLENLTLLILPILTLLLGFMAHITRMTRSSVMEEMRSAYARTAILKGLPTRTVVFKHVLRNALMPAITIIAANTGTMLGGLVIVETVFSYPGLGQLLLLAIKGLDAPLLLSITLLIAGVTYTSNLIADVIYIYINPRIRY